MFGKLSLMSFIYELVETCGFPKEKVITIYDKYLVEKVYIYHVLTNTDSSCLQFMFVSNRKSDICKKKIIQRYSFRGHKSPEIYDRLDSSNNYWEKFNARKEDLHRCLGYFEIKNIDNHAF